MLTGLLSACCCEEDRRKIEYIYLHYGKTIFYVINNRINDQRISEDLTHDLFVRLIKNVDSLDLSDERKLRSLMIILARHTVIDYERTKKDFVIDGNMSEALYDRVIEDSSAPDDYVVDKEAYEKLLDAIERLGDAYTPVFQLKYLHGYSNSEIAGLLNISSASLVGLRLFRGKKILMKMIGGDRNFENKQR